MKWMSVPRRSSILSIMHPNGYDAFAKPQGVPAVDIAQTPTALAIEIKAKNA